MSNRFLSCQRLKYADDIRMILTAGAHISDHGFVCCYAKTNREYSRLGVLIKKKYCALAVHRNVIKRLIREHFRLHQHQLRSLDMIVMLKSSIKNTQRQEYNTWLQNLFIKLSTHCEKFC